MSIMCGLITEEQPSLIVKIDNTFVHYWKELLPLYWAKLQVNKTCIDTLCLYTVTFNTLDNVPNFNIMIKILFQSNC